MDELTKSLREKADQAEKLAREAKYAGPAGVLVDVPDLRTLLAELDRLREFVSAVAVIRSEWRGTNEALDLELGEAIARATG